GGTRREASRIGAVHALILAHQQLHRAVFALVLVELDQAPVIPSRFRHGLVAVVKGCFAEGVAVPFEAGNLARLAADARSGVHQFAYAEFAIQSLARHASGVARDPDDFRRSLAHVPLLKPSRLSLESPWIPVCARSDRRQQASAGLRACAHLCPDLLESRGS